MHSNSIMSVVCVIIALYTHYELVSYIVTEGFDDPFFYVRYINIVRYSNDENEIVRLLVHTL